jgi:hypothetical protein
MRRIPLSKSCKQKICGKTLAARCLAMSSVFSAASSGRSTPIHWLRWIFKTIRELHELAKSGVGIDPLKDFSEIAREELQAFTST